MITVSPSPETNILHNTTAPASSPSVSWATPNSPSKPPVRFSPPLIAMVVIIAAAFITITYSRAISRRFLLLRRRWRRRFLRSYVPSSVGDIESPGDETYDPSYGYQLFSGLDDVAIKTIPLSIHSRKSSVHECAVCLLEFEDNDYVRTLPVCYQSFHLEGVLQNDDGLSQLASDSVHYNPSDLSSWLESMICELNPNAVFDTPPSVISPLCPDSDLQAIPGNAIYPPTKKHKPTTLNTNNINTTTTTTTTLYNPKPVVVVDTQENGIRLVHTLMACAEAVQQADLKIAETLVKQAGVLAVSQTGAMRKVATYFAEALGRRIYGSYPKLSQDSPAFQDMLQMHFYETCPYLKFAHFTANQAILEAFEGAQKVHVIDFSMKQGMQWPALMHALALRPGGPPSFRLSGIGPPSGDNTDHLQQVGWKLAQLAETIHVEFEYRGFLAESLADIEPWMLDLREGEIVALNSVFELHQLLARPGAIDKVLNVVKDMKPKIFTVVEQEANHNGPVFLERFTESLHYYSTLFNSLESSGAGGGGSENGDSGGINPVTNQDKIMSEVYLGKQICNVVACEGPDRVERHQTLTQWKTWFEMSGFEPVHLGSNAYKQASMLLALFAGGDGYRVEENNGCLMLGWHTRPLITTSAWKLR